MSFKSNIKDMEIDLRNKGRKTVHKFRQIAQHLLSRLNMINSSTAARSIENYDFKIFRSEIQPRLV